MPDETEMPEAPPQPMMTVEQAWEVVGRALAQARFPDLPLADIQTVLQAWGVVGAELTSAKQDGQRRTVKK